MECFIVLADEINERLDPFFYKLEFRKFINLLKSTKFKLFELSEIAIKITDGTHFTPTYLENGIPFLSVKDVRENKVSFGDTKYISREEHEKLIKRCKPESEDILLTKVGNTWGIAAVIPPHSKEFSIFVSLALIKIKKEIANPYYISLFLNSRIGNIQMRRRLKGIGQPDLHLEEIQKIRVPLPPLEYQNKIVQIIEKAYSIKKSKEFEARQLIDLINDYVLHELAIKLPELKDKMVYVSNSEEVQNKRIDAYYYQPKFEEVEKAIKKGKFEAKEIKNSLIINSELENINKYSFINYIDLSSIHKDLGIIKKISRLNSLEAPSRARQKLEKGDLLLSGLSGSLKSIAILDKEENNFIASTGFYVIKKSKNYNNYYLWALFRSSLFQMILQRECSGAIMSAINREALQDIKIPVPPLNVQNKIAEEVKKRMYKAEQFQEEAREELEKAKQEVENIMLGKDGKTTI